MALIKEVPIKKGPPSGIYETEETLQSAIDLAWGTPAHIHEGKINSATGYPEKYYVCYGDC